MSYTQTGDSHSKLKIIHHKPAEAQKTVKMPIDNKNVYIVKSTKNPATNVGEKNTRNIICDGEIVVASRFSTVKEMPPKNIPENKNDNNVCSKLSCGTTPALLSSKYQFDTTVAYNTCPPNLRRAKKEYYLNSALKESVNKIIVIMFSKLNCEPCSNGKKWFVRFATDNPAVLCIYINVNEYEQITQFVNEQISMYPTFMFVYNKQIIGTHEGYSPDDILQVYKSCIGQINESIRQQQELAKQQELISQQMQKIKLDSTKQSNKSDEEGGDEGEDNEDDGDDEESEEEDNNTEKKDIVNRDESYAEPTKSVMDSNLHSVTADKSTEARSAATELQKHIIQSFTPMLYNIPPNVWATLPRDQQSMIFQKHASLIQTQYNKMQNNSLTDVRMKNIQQMNEQHKLAQQSKMMAQQAAQMQQQQFLYMQQHGLAMQPRMQ